MTQPSSSATTSVEIKPRHMSFPFSDLKEKFFWGGNSVMSVFAGALSSTFPPGEGEFIESVRNYRDQVTDETLKQQIKGFIGQEGHHSHQHKQANLALAELGIDAVRLERHLERDLEKLKKRKYFTPKFRLAMTVGMEHLTAIMAEHILTTPESLGSLNGTVQELLHWHAVEEIEHKAVAFDVFMLCENDQKYLRRILRLVVVLFTLRIACYMVALLIWARKRPSWKELKEFGSFMFNKKTGLIPGIRSNYKDYFKPGFHPWDHANQDLVDMWKEKMYRPEHDLGLQRAKAKQEAKQQNLNDGLPA
ncbi:metal-dependent hydrolase [Oleispira antarctica]|uniref:Metal-dependent hydrolase n=1 Tax=Oleispira antarctica TaxID=188908 RepID=A0A1Y5HVJ3_OLEAN|nr:metal-dependent hydrolase [Oleispira antarctica]